MPELRLATNHSPAGASGSTGVGNGAIPIDDAATCAAGGLHSNGDCSEALSVLEDQCGKALLGEGKVCGEALASSALGLSARVSEQLPQAADCGATNSQCSEALSDLHRLAKGESAASALDNAGTARDAIFPSSPLQTAANEVRGMDRANPGPVTVLNGVSIRFQRNSLKKAHNAIHHTTA